MEMNESGVEILVVSYEVREQSDNFFVVYVFFETKVNKRINLIIQFMKILKIQLKKSIQIREHQSSLVQGFELKISLLEETLFGYVV